MEDSELKTTAVVFKARAICRVAMKSVPIKADKMCDRDGLGWSEIAVGCDNKQILFVPERRKRNKRSGKVRYGEDLHAIDGARQTISCSSIIVYVYDACLKLSDMIVSDSFPGIHQSKPSDEAPEHILVF